MTKYVFVTGGVVSGLGKGITAASLGRLLKQRGLKVAAQKLDPYMNVDPGTMSPFQHGEVFVTDDGAETDLDLGHYERFIDENLSAFSNLTSGKVYWAVLNRERAGGYLGETVQVIPHITQEIKNFIYQSARQSGADVLITEIGGTTGDIESQPFLEAIRQISIEKGLSNCLFLHVTLVPYLKSSGEHKSKPTQHSVKELRAMGISPNLIIARADEPLGEGIKEKIALFCNVKPDCVIENITLSSLYEAPLVLHRNGLDQVVCRELGIDAPEPDLAEWRSMTEKIAARSRAVTIAIVGKYVRLHDAYLSIMESLNHAGFETRAKVSILWVDSEELTEENAGDFLNGIDGMIIPGGFGGRGIEGKIAACRYAREHDIPFLGICLGMQIAVIEFARHVCGLAGANSGEFDPHGPHSVIDLMPDQANVQNKGGTMRLGAYPCRVVPGTALEQLYSQHEISERHRHRYEVNNAYRKTLEAGGLVVCGASPDNTLVEAVELPDKRFFVAVQFHPEFKSRPNKPHPLFLGLLRAAMGE
ncbi:CTP synthetase [uncultured Eubacteriales bacterium]|uniref:CTP synthase n=1 Tax=uncultured Eubacteriales bacterium TaxID=172733 RepID=A0A212K9N9_9FIRM|nr:CTP synthetase [uncultured Eubacteriales bacterium]